MSTAARLSSICSRRRAPHDRDDHAVWLPGTHPGDGHLSRGRPPLRGNRVERVGEREVACGQHLGAELGGGDLGALGSGTIASVASAEQARAKCAPSCHRKVESLSHRQQVALDVPPDQAVGNLESGKARPSAQVRERDRLRHEPRPRVRDPDVKHLAGADRIVERADDLLDRCKRVPHVDPIDVDVVGAKALGGWPRAWVRFLRWLPPALGSSGRTLSAYLVASTQWSRSCAISSPTMRSLVPLV
jgi:hypothetical protein